MMTKRNSLMEWLDQTKKLAKSKDYVCLDTIDSVFDVLPFISHAVLIKHKNLIDDICSRYHKPNPLHYDNNWQKKEQYFNAKNGIDFQEQVRKKLRKQFLGHHNKLCFGIRDWKSCGLAKLGMDLLSKYVDSSLNRCEMVQRDVFTQWFEIIDFMFERPELINPNAIDDYVAERINFVCKTLRKNNPLTNGVRFRFGKYWKDDRGHWHKERRRRI